ncbi:alpha/beta hydrolase [Lysinibacillus sp. KU-BSD001]|uniref:alpha/beta fold hydrolase n=1 Tax=Lysinibacillus sp. KU-BSD001 TaxID=3141328 RepID=UPI0036ECE25B
MPYLKMTDGVEIYYEVYGEGQPLVFIHGLGASCSMYKPQVEYFKPFFKIILIDLRGNGNSGKLETNIQGVLPKQADDIKQLLRYLHIKNALFVGVSYGGVLIQKLAIVHPEVVRGLIIVDSFCDTSINSIQKLFAMVGAYQTWVLHMPKKLIANLTKTSYKQWPLASDEMHHIILNMRTKETKIQRKAVNKVNFTKDLNTINVPVLCLVGDYTTLGVQMMMQVASCIPNSEMRIIENSFDPSNLCQPEVFNHLVQNFMVKLDVPADMHK